MGNRYVEGILITLCQSNYLNKRVHKILLRGESLRDDAKISSPLRVVGDKNP